MVKGKVEELGEEAQKRAIKLNVEGLSHSAVADKLNEEFNSNLSTDNVATFLRRNKNKSFQIMKDTKNFDQKMAQTYFNTLNQMNTLNSELWKFFYEIKKEPELKDKIIKCTKCGRRMVFQMQSYGLLLKTAEQILKSIDHVDKVMGRIKDKSFTVNYNIVDMSKKLQIAMPQLFHNAERQGIIRILNKKRLKEL